MDKFSIERRNRIKITAYAIAYELYNESIVSDQEYDALAKEIDLSIDTGRPMLDNFFKEHYSPDTGSWVRKHPELKRAKEVVEKYYLEKT